MKCSLLYFYVCVCAWWSSYIYGVEWSLRGLKASCEMIIAKETKLSIYTWRESYWSRDIDIVLMCLSCRPLGISKFHEFNRICNQIWLKYHNINKTEKLYINHIWIWIIVRISITKHLVKNNFFYEDPVRKPWHNVPTSVYCISIWFVISPSAHHNNI